MNFDFGDTSLEYKQQARTLLDEELTVERLDEVRRTGTFHHWDFHRALAARGWLAPQPGLSDEKRGAPAPWDRNAHLAPPSVDAIKPPPPERAPTPA